MGYASNRVDCHIMSRETATCLIERLMKDQATKGGSWIDSRAPFDYLRLTVPFGFIKHGWEILELNGSHRKIVYNHL